MASKIEWFLVELERMLKGRISDKSLRELQAESHAHLKGLANQQNSPEPELEAIRLFGSPSSIAWKYLQSCQRAPKWVTVLILVSAAACLTWPIALSVFFAPGARTLDFQILAVLVLAFVVASAFGKRLFLKPLVGLCTVMTLAWAVILSFNMVVYPFNGGVVLERTDIARRILAMSEDEVVANDFILKLDKGVAAFTASSTSEDARLKEFRTENGFLVPVGIVNRSHLPFDQRSFSFQYEFEESFSKAQSRWRDFQSGPLAALRFEIGYMSQLRERLRQAPAPSLINFLPVLLSIWRDATSGTILLLFLHFLAVQISRMSERIAVRRRRLA